MPTNPDTLPVYSILIVVGLVFLFTTQSDHPRRVFRTSLFLPFLTWIFAGLFLFLFYEPKEALIHAFESLPAASAGIIILYLAQSLKFRHFRKREKENHPSEGQ